LILEHKTDPIPLDLLSIGLSQSFDVAITKHLWTTHKQYPFCFSLHPHYASHVTTTKKTLTNTSFGNCNFENRYEIHTPYFPSNQKNCVHISYKLGTRSLVTLQKHNCQHIGMNMIATNRSALSYLLKHVIISIDVPKPI
jgi:hypothetical protein